MRDLEPASPCESCLSPPERIPVPPAALPAEIPASVAWLRSEEPVDLAEKLRRDAAIEVASVPDVASMRERLNVRAAQAGGAVQATPLLATVVLSLAARGRVTLIDVSHRAGWTARVFGKAGAGPTLHIAAAGSPAPDDGAIETKLLEAVARKTGRKMPHGPTLQAAIEALIPSMGTGPGHEILWAAKGDGVARGIARWITKQQDTPGPGLIGRLVHHAGGLKFYEILPARERAVESQRAALEKLRTAVADRDSTLLARLEKEIERGIDARTSSD